MLISLAQRVRQMRQRLQAPPLNDPLSTHVHSAQGVQLAAQPARVHVLARALCRFRWIDFAHLPASEQLGFVRVQLSAWQPFAQTDWALVLAPQGAMVWAWDGAAWLQRCQDAGLTVQRAQVLPEPLLYAPPQAPLPDGPDASATAPSAPLCVLLRCHEGWEAQCWRQGSLRASHWWAQPPQEAAWQNFLRGAGAAPQALPAPEQLPPTPRLERPWGQLRMGRALQDGALLQWQVVLAAVLLPMLWISGYEWLALWQTQAQAQSLELQQEQLRQEAGPLLQARERVLADQAVLAQVLAQVDRPTPLQVLTHVQQRLASDARLAGTIVRELHWSQEGQLRLALQVPAAAARVAYVQALEGGGWLQQVRELPAEGSANAAWLVLQASAQGRPGAPPTPADENGGAS